LPELPAEAAPASLFAGKPQDLPTIPAPRGIGRGTFSAAGN